MVAPAGTVSITVYFHASREQLAANGRRLPAGARCAPREFRHGFSDQTVQLWNEAGTMLATSHQIVYYRSERTAVRCYVPHSPL